MKRPRIPEHWAIALAVAFVLGAVVLLPGLGSFGLWEPQERQLADKAAPRPEVEQKNKEAEGKAEAAAAQAKANQKPKPGQPPPVETCPRTPPKDASARQLTQKAAAWGRDTFGDDDAGRRLPLALLGLLTVLALVATTLRLASMRAAIIAAFVGLSFPLFVLQARQLTSEIGTAAGAATLIYGLVALSKPSTKNPIWFVADLASGVFAVAIGVALGFYGGGALLGVAVPFGAVAAAGAFGWRVYKTDERPLNIVAIAATLCAIAALALIAYDIYELKDPVLGAVPLQRTIFGKVVAATACWSDTLGGTWRTDEDLRMIFDSTWEQIAYGTYPWGVLAPIAIGWLVTSSAPKRRRLGALTLAWAGLAWLATEAFQRKVGFALWAGFPAFAIALGAWLDGVLLEVKNPSADRAAPRGAVLVGLYAILAVLDIGKDMQEFADKVSSMLVGGEVVPYPSQSHVFLVPAKIWILVFGMIVALGMGVAMIVWREREGFMRRFAGWCVAAALAGTALLVAFWPFAWQPELASHISSKGLFETYLDLRAPGDQLVVMGDMGDAAHDYAPDATPEQLASREQVVQALGRPGRVFAIAPQTELCQLHREVGGKPYFVIDDRNARSLLLSNRVDGTTDKNPLAFAIVHSEPKDIPQRPKGKVVWDNKIQLLGWDIPKSADRSGKMTITMYYKILAPVGGAWKILFHFDSNAGARFNGDHDPINNRCQTSTWQKDDYIIDTYTLIAGNASSPYGPYEVWTGFFTGTNPNWKNMTISEAPPDMRDPAGTDRVKIMTLDLE